FALGQKREAPEVVRKLLPLLADEDLRVARTALDTLSNLSLPTAAIAALEKLALAGDETLARGAIARLGAMGEPSLKALIAIALAAPQARGEEAVRALG